MYHLRYFFDWGTSTCLWSANDAARRTFGYPVDPHALPLSPQTCASIERLATWHDTALNWDYPPNPGPWRQEECERFTVEAAALLRTIRDELGPDFTVSDEFKPLHEDPELDAYLRDPQRFKRQP